VAEEQADREPGELRGGDAPQRIEGGDHDQPVERAPGGERGGDAVADAEGDCDHAAAGETGAGEVVDERRILAHPGGARAALARRVAAIVEGDDVGLGIEGGQHRRHVLGVPAIAAEAEDQQPFAARLPRRNVDAAQPFAGSGGELQPLGAGGKRTGGGDVSDRKEHARLREEHDRADDQIDGERDEDQRPHQLLPPRHAPARPAKDSRRFMRAGTQKERKLCASRREGCGDT
jgi:hypothetical protein